MIKPLAPETFSAWLALAQKYNGVWGGCYCSYFHDDTHYAVKSEYDGPTFKQRLVAEGVAHAALVFDGDDAIAWCVYGSPVELAGIYHSKEYDAGRLRRHRGASRASSSTAPTSALIAAGLHPKEIQVRLGHATISETMDTYGHLFPALEESGRGALDGLLAAQPEIPRKDSADSGSA